MQTWLDRHHLQLEQLLLVFVRLGHPGVMHCGSSVAETENSPVHGHTIDKYLQEQSPNDCQSKSYGRQWILCLGIKLEWVLDEENTSHAKSPEAVRGGGIERPRIAGSVLRASRFLS